MLPYLIAAVVCWNLTNIVVNDDVFEGTRDSVFAFLGRILGPTRPDRKWGLRPMERWARTRVQANRLGRRTAAQSLTDRLDGLLADSTSQQAVLSTAWYRFARWVAPRVFGALFIHHLPIRAVYALLGLARLFVEKVSLGLACPFCVAVWLGWPSWWLATDPHVPSWLLGFLVASGIARLAFHATTLSRSLRQAAAAYTKAASGPG